MMRMHLLDPWQGDALSVANAGGKGASLQALRQAGVQVPRFVVVSAAAFEAMVALPDLPQAFLDELQASLGQAGLDKGFLAVRSSALAEDGAKASYAGQFETVLGVQAAEEMCIRDRVRGLRCTASTS